MFVCKDEKEAGMAHFKKHMILMRPLFVKNVKFNGKTVGKGL